MKSVVKMKSWIKEQRNCRLRNMISKLNDKLRGYYNYYGVIGNWKKIQQFYNIVKKLFYKWFNRRSQRRSFNWTQFGEKIKWYNLQKPFIKTEYEQLRFSC